MKRRQIPHTFVIVFALIVFAAVLTLIVPAGHYVKEGDTMRFYYEEQMSPELASSYHSQGQTWQIFSAFFEGFERQSSIIVFILLIGGAFWILNKSHAIDLGILSFLKATRKLERHRLIAFLGVDNIVIVLIMLLFSFFGAVFGMSEECIAFVVIIIPLAISMGYDSITGLCMVYVAAHIGFAGAILNPFTIGIAQGIAGIPLFSGLEYRIFCWLIITVVGIALVLFYAHRVKKNPQSSLMYNDDAYWRQGHEAMEESFEMFVPRSAYFVFGALLIALIAFSIYYPSTTITVGNNSFTCCLLPVLTALFGILGFLSLRKTVHHFILLILAFTVVFLLVGVLGYGWYVMEIATLFLVMGIASGLAVGYDGNAIAKDLLDGMKDIFSAAVVVGLAAGIVIVLEHGGVIDTLLYGLSQSLGDFGRVASVEIMYGIQTLINIVIPSGSAKAAITMPIMAPFGDLIGVSRQATVMAFQFGDGFTNMITPTSGVLIAALGVARIPYQKWLRWVWRFIVVMVILGALLLIPTVLIDLNGF